MTVELSGLLLAFQLECLQIFVDCKLMTNAFNYCCAAAHPMSHNWLPVKPIAIVIHYKTWWHTVNLSIPGCLLV
jgi:hypothetical protein